MKRTILTFAAALMFLGMSAAEDAQLWLRKNRISPDGKQIAFCYKGDIFVVPAEGGKAVQVTSNAAYDSDPLWTPDGKHIIFSSYRDKSKDIFMTSPGGLCSLPTSRPMRHTGISRVKASCTQQAALKKGLNL